MRSLDEICSSDDSYISALDSGDYEQAKLATRAAINDLKVLLNNPPQENAEQFLNCVFCVCVFFRALHDFAMLEEMTKREGWFRDKKCLETVWHKLCDCKDRLEFTQPGIAGLTVERIASSLEKLRSFYSEHFGQGMYVSPVILVKCEICSICRIDLRSCHHLAGRIYSGQLCSGIQEILDLKSVDFVQVPRDPRCRIWPWQIEGDKIPNIKIMCLFALDDFIETDEWK